MNAYVKIALGVLGAIAIGLQTAYPHAAWAIPVTAAITAALTALHVAPVLQETPVPQETQGTSKTPPGAVP